MMQGKPHCLALVIPQHPVGANTEGAGAVDDGLAVDAVEGSSDLRGGPDPRLFPVSVSPSRVRRGASSRDP